MPSVASEVSASQQSRFYQTNTRARTDGGDRSQDSPFSELLDNAAPTAKPPSAPRNARTDKTDAPHSADQSLKTDAPADPITPNNAKDTSNASDTTNAKAAANTDARATIKKANASDDGTALANSEDSTATTAADAGGKTKPDGDLAAVLQAMFVDPAQHSVVPADGIVVAALHPAAADTPAPDAAAPHAAAAANAAPQIDALIASQATEPNTTPANFAASNQGQTAAADHAADEAKLATQVNGSADLKSDDPNLNNLKTDAERERDIKSDAKSDAESDAKALTKAKTDTAADPKTAAAPPQSDQDRDTEPQSGGHAADAVRQSAAKPAGENPELEPRSRHAADAAGAAKTGTAAHQNAGTPVTTGAADVAAATTVASSAALGSGAAQAQPQTLTPAHLQVQLQAQIQGQIQGQIHGQANIAPAVTLGGVAVEIATQASAGKQHFEIRLDPPELGRIDVKLAIDSDGNTTTRLVVERSGTLDLLKRDANQLERALQQAGLKTPDNAMEFSLRQQFAQNDDQGASNAVKIVVSDDEAAPFPAQRQSYGRLLGAGGGLDIRV